MLAKKSTTRKRVIPKVTAAELSIKASLETLADDEVEKAQRIVEERESARLLRNVEMVSEIIAGKELASDHADRVLFETELLHTRAEAKFHGNLGLKFLRGITQDQIGKMIVRDRVTSAKICFTTRDQLLDRPTATINFSARQNMATAIEELRKEGERRERERMTIDVTPHSGNDKTG